MAIRCAMNAAYSMRINHDRVERFALPLCDQTWITRIIGMRLRNGEFAVAAN
ncbi:hypothetical protein LG3211_2326 [Lysobacter gummosus]|nr:hypothetical protein LG3211_2326 [Lysobacter gummosus]